MLDRRQYRFPAFSLALVLSLVTMGMILLAGGTPSANADPADDEQNASFETQPVTITDLSGPDLALSRKVANRVFVNPGGLLSFDVVVSNSGGTSTLARVTDTLPISLTYLADTLQSTMGNPLYDSSTGTVYWAGPALSGVPVTISYQAKAPSPITGDILLTSTAALQSTGGAPLETLPVTITIVSNASRAGWSKLGPNGEAPADPAAGDTPDTQYATESTGLPKEAPIDAVAQNPRDVNTIYVASSSGFGRSSDSGQSWTWLAGLDSVHLQAGSAIVVDSAAVYVSGRGLARSVDNGQSWVESNLGTLQAIDLGNGRAAQVREIGIVPGEPQHLFAALAEPATGSNVAGGGVYESTDGGITWTATGLSGTPVHTLGFGGTANGTIIYAGVGVGDPWVAANPANGTSTVDNTAVWLQTSITNTYVEKLKVDPTNGLVVYAGGAVPGTNPAMTVLYKTTDGGVTSSNLIPNASAENAVRAIAIDPLSPNLIFYASGSRVFQSTDGGKTWSVFASAGLDAQRINALLVPLPVPSPVVTLTASLAGDQAVLSWTNPSDSDFGGVLLKYSTDGFQVLSTDGITVTDKPGMPGATQTWTQPDIDPSATYYFSAFAYNKTGQYSRPIQKAANSAAAGLSSDTGELQVRLPASLPRRPAARASTRNLYVAAGGGLFAKPIEIATPLTGTTSTYLPALMK